MKITAGKQPATWFLLFFVLLITSCSGLQVNKLGVAPGLDLPIRSVNYYKKNYNVDLLSMNHDMEEEIAGVIRANQSVNRLGRGIVIGGKSVQVKPEYQHFRYAKRQGSNSYSIGLEKVLPVEKQIDDYSCWASCVQYLITYGYGKRIDQKSIVEQIKQSNITADPGASVIEIMEALGYFSTRLSSSGSMQVIEILGRGHPLIIGSRENTNESGHAEIIVGAKFSFVNPYSPALPPQEAIAFSELTVLDPWDGKLHVKPATEYDDKINFILSFNVKE